MKHVRSLDEQTILLRYIQPGLVGLIDGTLSPLAPIFAAALARGIVTGVMTAFGGVFHSLPFLIKNVNTALVVAGIVVAVELITISLIRKRFLAVSLRTSLLQVALGGALIVAAGVGLGSA